MDELLFFESNQSGAGFDVQAVLKINEKDDRLKLSFDKVLSVQVNLYREFTRLSGSKFESAIQKF